MDLIKRFSGGHITAIKLRVTVTCLGVPLLKVWFTSGMSWGLMMANRD